MYSKHNQNQGEARLELLLDDLQSTLPRKNHVHSNTSSSGYREVTKSTSRSVGNGQMETNKEYEIQYLNPVNKSTVLNERLPDLQSVDLLRQTTGGKNAGYETVSSYQYKKSTESKGAVPSHETNGVNMRKSITELDSLLDDLNHAQRVGFSSPSVRRHETITTESNIEPLRTSTPYKQYSKHEEHRYGSLNRSKAPGATEIVSNYESSMTNGEPLDLVDGPHSYTKLLQNQTPGTYQTSVYSKETTKKIIPGTTTYSTYQKFGSPTTEPGQSKVYNYSEEYRTDSRNRSIRDLPPSPRSHRSSSPRSPSPHRSPSPMSFAQPPEPKNYSSGSHSSSTYNTTRTISPQPVQKFSPSDPSRTNEEVTWVAHATPPVTRRFPVSSENTFATPAGQTVYSYKYSSETRENTKYGQPTSGYVKPVHQEQLPLRQSPFPRDDVDTPGIQNPPKRLDDLMASFGDRTDYTTYQSSREQHHTNSNGYQSKTREYEKDKAAEYTIPIKKPQSEDNCPEKLVEIKEPEVIQTSAAGPPVFYPPGATTFVKKEDALHQQGQFGGGKMKAKGKGMYKYKSKSKSKGKESSGATMVPVCLPMCCAMPCVVM